MKKILVITLILLTFLSAFAKGAKEVKVDNTSDLRIVSLAPNVTEIVCALGLEDNLVGRTDYCNYPKSVSSVQSIGTLYDPNIELICALQPDVVIASSIVDPSVIEKLENAGIKAYQFLEEYNGIEGAYNLIREVSKVVAKPVTGEKLIAESRKTIEDVMAKTSSLETRKSCVLLISWGDWGDFAATGDTYLHEVLLAAGAENIAKDAMYWSISKELLLSEDPDVVLMTSDSNWTMLPLDEAFMTSAPYNTLSASQNAQVFILDSDSVQRQGIRTADAVVMIAKALYPEISL